MTAATLECSTCTRPETSSEIIAELPLESTFPLNPEINFRATNKNRLENDPDYLTPDQVDFYQRENLVCFLCEFAGKVPYKKIPGLFTAEGELRICNMDVLRMAENSYHMSGQGTREESEYRSWQKAIDSMSFGANRVDIVSPPKIADYMLTFSLKLDDYDPALGGRPVHQVVTRRDEDMESLETSRDVYKKLSANAGINVDADAFSQADDFVNNPIVHFTHDTDSLARAIASIGISQDEIAFSEQYEAEIRSTLAPMINDYLHQVEELSKLDSRSQSLVEVANFNDKKHTLDLHLKTIFSFAKRIGREMREGQGTMYNPQHVREIVKLQEVDPRLYYAQAELIRQSERATITGGSSCPSINSIASIDSMSALSSEGVSFDGAMHSFMGQESKKTLRCTCPNCEKKVEARIGNNKITCPNCKASAPYKC